MSAEFVETVVCPQFPPAVPQMWDEARTRVFQLIVPVSRQVLCAFEIEAGQEKQVHPYAALTDHITVQVECPLDEGVAEAADALLAAACYAAPVVDTASAPVQHVPGLSARQKARHAVGLGTGVRQDA